MPTHFPIRFTGAAERYLAMQYYTYMQIYPTIAWKTSLQYKLHLHTEGTNIILFEQHLNCLTLFFFLSEEIIS